MQEGMEIMQSPLAVSKWSSCLLHANTDPQEENVAFF